VTVFVKAKIEVYFCRQFLLRIFYWKKIYLIKLLYKYTPAPEGETKNAALRLTLRVGQQRQPEILLNIDD